MEDSDDDAIRARAFQLWEEGGRVHGQHDAHWRQAEQEHAAASVTAPAGREVEETAAQHVDGVSTLPPQDEDESPPGA